jgi:DNA (cytosine-5)-methyltransferase 1
MSASVVDLFCGIGGMTHGFIREGFRVRAGVDLDRTCRFAFEANNRGARFLEADVESLQSWQVNAFYPHRGPRVLIGCAPCQPFSRYTNRSTPDDKWRLLRSFAKLATAVRPDVISMENVPQLERHGVFYEFVRALEKAEYSVTHYLAPGPEYGIPQRRTRLVLFASQHGPVPLIDPTHSALRRPTLRRAIAHLPAIEAGEVCRTDTLHRARGLSELNLRRIRATAEGGTWKDWDESLRLDCHKRPEGSTYRSVYGRLRWDEPGSVITTQFVGIGNGRFGHPDQDRALSLREAALIQTFPMNYRLIDPTTKKVSLQTIARHIGNAVPVRLGRIIARSIRRHLKDAHG